MGEQGGLCATGVPHPMENREDYAQQVSLTPGRTVVYTQVVCTQGGRRCIPRVVGRCIPSYGTREGYPAMVPGRDTHHGV